MTKIKTAVIGTGHLGGFHARVLSVLKNCEFVCVVDVDEERGREIAVKYNVPYVRDFRRVVGEVDAVTIATPTMYHFDVARFFIENKIHVMVEKPITANVDEAEQLIEMANHRNVKLQVGHIERFNRAFTALKENVTTPWMIRANRYAPFTGRSTDIDVVLDLMIHDMDLVFALDGSPVKRITVKGTKVVTEKTDIAFAMVELESGCIAELNVSRVASERERSLKVFDGDVNTYYSADLNNRKLKKMFFRDKQMVSHPLPVEDRDQLEAEIASFLDSIISNRPVEVSGEDGLKALLYTKEVSDMAASGKCFTEF
ncbi:MAG: Gfo/Idh/MocA family oxidoreductase [Acidobacteria bacterium]|nr:Gfo/Idh/MocA family oxidoreductase [Acidobacteriota bacterium]